MTYNTVVIHHNFRLKQYLITPLPEKYRSQQQRNGCKKQQHYHFSLTILSLSLIKSQEKNSFAGGIFIVLPHFPEQTNDWCCLQSLQA